MGEYGLWYRLTCNCNGGEAVDVLQLWADLVLWVQTRLAEHGFDPGALDGIRGPKTDAALVRFKASRALRDRPYIGPLTLAALNSEPRPLPGANAEEPDWLVLAREYLGLREIAGPEDAPEIVQWWKDIGAHWFDDDETPWCGAFVGGILYEAGLEILEGAEAPRAQAWQHYGARLVGPAVGAIAVLWRGSPSSPAGHVAFVVGRDRRGNLALLGGNQSDAVTIDFFDPDRVIAFVWPEDEPVPADTGWNALPLVDRDGRPLSRDEA